MSAHTHKNEEFVLAKRSEGIHDLHEVWKLQTSPFPVITPGQGEFITESLFVSVDPYLSSTIKNSALGGASIPLGNIQVSAVVSRVIETDNTEFPVGTVFTSRMGWRRLKVIKKPGQEDTLFDRLGYGSALGSLGMPSQTAYYGAKDVGKFGPSDILVVSGAAGAVGTILGQIAKKVLKCQKVIGVAGGKKKCEYIVNELGYDAAVDYKEYDTKEKVAARLQELAGAPITAYFDNTGGFVTEAVFDIIGRHGRIIICGQISTYNHTEKEFHSYPNYLAKTIYRGLSILGFVVGDFVHRNEQEFFVDMPRWIEEGVVKVHETRVEGFENLPRAYEMLYTGENIGKIVVKV